MPPHELVRDGVDRVGDCEMPSLGFELREKHRLEQEVAELFAERVVVVPVDRLEDFVGFLEHERLQRVDRLLAIPRTAVRGPEPRHDLE
jgi:hypothetical protein